MSQLRKKLLRDLGRMWAQALSIALVVAAGVATFVSLAGAHASLHAAMNAFYERNRFADVFGRCERAPESVRGELAALPGVRRVETRVVLSGLLTMDGLPEPATAHVLSLPEGRAPLHEVFVREGRLAERANEVVLLEGFAKAHGVQLGATLPLVLRGHRLEVRVVGIGLSPEYVLAVPAGDVFPDPKRFAVLWMARSELAPLGDLEGAFNDVLFQIEPGVDPRDVTTRADGVLDRWGGGKAFPRSKHLSHAALKSELEQLEKTTRFIPMLFFLVAAFLLNVVLARTVELERQEIATLRSLGLSGWEVARHYLELVGVVAVLGAALGVVLGGLLGGAFLGVYADFYRFPDLSLKLDAGLVATAVVGSLGAGAIGALRSLRTVAKMQPAEAMRPAAPARYGKGFIEWLGVGAFLSPGGRIVLREISRRPVRAALSALAIGLSTGLLVTARFSLDSVDLFMRILYEDAMREDMTVMFVKPVAQRGVRALAHIPGVRRAEGIRLAPVRFRVAAGYRDGAIFGYPPDSEFRHAVGWPEGATPMPTRGLLMGRKLAEVLEVRLGDSVRIESLSGERRISDAPVVGLVGELFGMNAYASPGYLEDLLGEPEEVDGAALAVDPNEETPVLRELRKLPNVASVAIRRRTIEKIWAQMDKTTGFTTTLLTAFAAIIAVGVLYNNARVALSTRGRELASLRVLGFTQGEVTRILLGELGIQAAVGLPMGLWIGKKFVDAMMSTVDPETYRMPTAIYPETYAFAAFVTVLAAVASAVLVARRLGELDMIEALKTRG